MVCKKNGMYFNMLFSKFLFLFAAITSEESYKKYKSNTEL